MGTASRPGRCARSWCGWGFRCGACRSAPRSNVRTMSFTVPELAHRLDRPLGTLYAWIRYGWLPVRRVPVSDREILLVRLGAAQALVEQRRAAARAMQAWTPPTPQTAE